MLSPLGAKVKRIGRENAGALAEAGCTVLVAGSAIFGKPDVAKAIRELREAAKG